MELLVNQEGKIFGWMSKTDIIYTLRRIGDTIEFWPTRDYPERSEWGQKVTPTQPKSGDYVTISGVTYLLLFTRFAKGSDVAISPVPEDWDPQPSLFWRRKGTGINSPYYAVDKSGRLVTLGDTDGVALTRDSRGTYKEFVAITDEAASAYSAWGHRNVQAGLDFPKLIVDGFEYTLTTDEIAAGQWYDITPALDMYQ